MLFRSKRRIKSPKTSRDISNLKKLLSEDVISQPADQPPTEPTKPQLSLETPLCQFDRVSFDICGPNPISEDGNKYVLAFCDHWSRFIIACAIPDKSANTAESRLDLNEFMVS